MRRACKVQNGSWHGSWHAQTCSWEQATGNWGPAAQRIASHPSLQQITLNVRPPAGASTKTHDGPGLPVQPTGRSKDCRSPRGLLRRAETGSSTRWGNETSLWPGPNSSSQAAAAFIIASSEERGGRRRRVATGCRALSHAFVRWLGLGPQMETGRGSRWPRCGPDYGWSRWSQIHPPLPLDGGGQLPVLSTAARAGLGPQMTVPGLSLLFFITLGLASSRLSLQVFRTPYLTFPISPREREIQPHPPSVTAHGNGPSEPVDRGFSAQRRKRRTRKKDKKREGAGTAQWVDGAMVRWAWRASVPELERAPAVLSLFVLMQLSAAP